MGLTPQARFGSPTWEVVVPTRGAHGAIQGIRDNIAMRLLGVPLTLVINVREGEIDAGTRAVAEAQELGMKATVCVGGGVARARNRGLSESTADVVAFFDDDVIVSFEAATALVSTLASSHLFIATARVLPAAGPSPATTLWRRYLSFDRGDSERSWRLGAKAPTSPFAAWDLGVGAAFAVDARGWRSAFSDVLFDERLSNGCRCGGTEDVDFFYSAYRRGLPVGYVASCVVTHQFPATIGQVRKKCRQYALADGMFYAKWARCSRPCDWTGELAGWVRRVAIHAQLRWRGEPAVPISALLAEPLYKLVGGMAWAQGALRS